MHVGSAHLCGAHAHPTIMRNITFTSLALLTGSLIACATPAERPIDAQADRTFGEQPGQRKAYFAAGCFWVMEAMFEDLKGVSHVYSGYCGGSAPSPSYEQVCSGRTGHAETVEVIYDPEVISYATLLKVFFGSQDPTQVNGQGPDEGTQYRSAIFYQNPEEKAQAEKMIAELNAAHTFTRPIASEVAPFTTFWRAEDYHQGYEKLHPDQPYVATVSKRRYDAFAAKFRDLLK